jgi:hypothetical protein
MTAPERRRPLPALAFIGALCLLTALVWFRVLHRSDSSNADSAGTSPCPTVSASPTHAPPSPTVLPVPQKVNVLVLNSTNRDGIAGDATKLLSKEGFKVDKAQDDSSTYGGHGLIKGVGEIRYPATALPSATLLGYYFPHAKLQVTDSSNSTVMVALGAKYKKVATTRIVRHELHKAHITLTHKRVQTHSAAPSPSC